MSNKRQRFWLILIGILVIVISALHYLTPTMKWQYHLIYMQSYFIPILIGAFQFGIRGGLGTALAVSFIYFPHVMLQWGGLIETNMMRFLQIFLFNLIGYVTGVISQQRMQENERYQHAVSDLEQSLKKLKTQSKHLAEVEDRLRHADRLSVVGELTASLAHEIRNPLGAIRGATEILRDELPKEARRSEFFKILINETMRLSAVLENYLSFARNRKHYVEKSDLAAVINSVTQLLTHSAQKAGVRFKFRFPNYPISILIDPNQLRQVLINLLLNAVQAMSLGGEITISAEKTVPVNREEFGSAIAKAIPYLRLSIRDQGPGIPDNQRQKIFQPFYTTKPNGTGLGLAIVRRLVDQNHWKIEIHSETGKGTEVILIIPFRH